MAKSDNLLMLANDCSAEKLTAIGQIQRFPRREIELFIARNFLGPEECADLIRLIDERRRPSTIADPNGDELFRTSETCDLDHGNPLVAAVDAKICALAAIDRRFGEPLQGQRYAVGQQFKPHTDYFEPDGQDYEKYCAISGQRTWTFMIYLNQPKAGGNTRFVHFKKSFAPQTGSLLCWNNRHHDGTVNPWTLHHGMKVRSGCKYIITKWFREKPWPWESSLR